ncbi:MAG: hypothetical protein RJB61_44 [Actinomycetota bacterium]
MTHRSALAGRRVVVTRAADQSSLLEALLATRGAHPVLVPLIEIVAVEEGASALRQLNPRDAEWLIVTSPNAVESYLRIHRAVPASVAAIGTATAAALAEHGVRATLVPSEQRAVGLVTALSSSTPPSTAIVVQSADAAPDLVDGLRAAGWTVSAVATHRAVPRQPSAAEQLAALSADAVLFASGSAARAWSAAFGDAAPPIVVAIGPQCASEARRLGLQVTAVAERHSVVAMVDTLEDILEGR